MVPLHTRKSLPRWCWLVRRRSRPNPKPSKIRKRPSPPKKLTFSFLGNHHLSHSYPLLLRRPPTSETRPLRTLADLNHQLSINCSSTLRTFVTGTPKLLRFLVRNPDSCRRIAWLVPRLPITRVTSSLTSISNVRSNRRIKLIHCKSPSL